MRKLSLSVAVSTLAIALAACGDAENADAAEATLSPAAQTEAAPVAEAEMAQDAQTDDAAEHDGHDDHHKTMAGHTMTHTHPSLEAPATGADAEASFVDNDGDVVGTAIISGGPKGILLRVDVDWLAEGFHGLHLHQIGDCSDPEAGFKASGSHVNPEGNQHGLMNAAGYEVADLPNIYAHSTGHARAELFVAGLMLEDAMDEDGFAIVVHENPDDHQTQPIGGAGARKACAAFN